MESNFSLNNNDWPAKLEAFPDLMTPVEAAMFLRLDEIGHTLKHIE